MNILINCVFGNINDMIKLIENKEINKILLKADRNITDKLLTRQSVNLTIPSRFEDFDTTLLANLYIIAYFSSDEDNIRIFNTINKFIDWYKHQKNSEIIYPRSVNSPV